MDEIELLQDIDLLKGDIVIAVDKALSLLEEANEVLLEVGKLRQELRDKMGGLVK